jgi:DNA polymerase elongation subunit (family B)
MNNMKDFPLFYFLVEKPEYLKYILYSDTDSMFMQLLDTSQLREFFNISSNELTKDDIKRIDDEFIQNISVPLNQTLKELWFKHILKRANVEDEQYNTLDFKTEMILNFILYGDKKKRYVYRILKEKKKIFDKPLIQIKGFELTRSDASKFVKDLQTAIINVFLENEEPKQLRAKFKETAELYKQKLKTAVDRFDIDYIGIPKNWSAREYKKDPSYVLGAKFYNTFIQDRIRPGTKGLTIPVEFVPVKFKKYYEEFRKKNLNKQFHTYQLDIHRPETLNLILEKVTNIFIPPEVNKEKLKEFFEQAGVKISLKTLMDSSYKTKLAPFEKLIVKILREQKGGKKTGGLF